LPGFLAVQPVLTKGSIVKNLMFKAGEIVRRPVAFAARHSKACAVGAVTVAGSAVASAQTDLSSTITTVSGYWTSVQVLAIGVLLFVVGRKIVKKI
jgi:hypothetical protein